MQIYIEFVQNKGYTSERFFYNENYIGMKNITYKIAIECKISQKIKKLLSGSINGIFI